MTNTMTLTNKSIRTMQVTGKAKLSVAPDSTCLLLMLRQVEQKYSDALEAVTNDTEKLRQVVIRLGFDGKDLKTTNFNVEEENRWVRNKETGESELVFSGFECKHEMKLSFRNNNDLLGRIIEVLSNCGVNVTFKIRYFVSDPEPVRNVLLSNAIADSRTKAKVLADASDVLLGDIIKVDYSWGKIELSSEPMKGEVIPEFLLKSKMDIVPDNINVNDTVTIVWEIK